MAAFAAHIHVYTGSSHSRFPENEKEITIIEEAFNSWSVTKENVLTNATMDLITGKLYLNV